MWPITPQKWQTGTLVFLETDLVTCFGFCLNKEQFGLMWPTTPQRWQVDSKAYLLCTIAVGLDTGLETSAFTFVLPSKISVFFIIPLKMEYKAFHL